MAVDILRTQPKDPKKFLGGNLAENCLYTKFTRLSSIVQLY